MSTDCLIKRPSSGTVQRRRAALFKQSPICHWCAQTTHEWTGQTDDLLVTLDHIKPRAACKTIAEYRDDANTVLSCHRCNQDRNSEYMRTHRDHMADYRIMVAHVLKRRGRPRMLSFPPNEIPLDPWLRKPVSVSVMRQWAARRV